MSKVMYSIESADGKVFESASYNDTRVNGNRIIKTYLIDDTPESEATKAARERYQRKRAQNAAAKTETNS